MGKKSNEKSAWDTKLGRDCVSLDTALCRWLGKRLSYLAKHSNAVPVSYIDACKFESGAEGFDELYHECWKREMSAAGESLTRYCNMFQMESAEVTAAIADGREAMRWVAKWLPDLWD